MSGLVKAIALNNPSGERKNLYILSYEPDEPALFTGGQLSNYFNLIFLYYDLYSSHKMDNGSQLIMAELITIIEQDDDAIVFGHSFNGYIAHQLACFLPQISYCVMIDSYNFFELGAYKGKHFFSNLLGNMYKQIIKNKDYIYPFWLLRNYYRNQTFVQSDAGIDFTKGVDSFLEHFKNKLAINNCIFFKASRSFFRYKEHGYSWEPYVKGQFYLKNIITDHKHIMDTINTAMAEYIYEKVSKNESGVTPAFNIT